MDGNNPRRDPRRVRQWLGEHRSAIQIVYNLSLLAFLIQILLIDHDGPPDWRDWCGAAAGPVAVASSGFDRSSSRTLLFMAMRRRWIAAG
jgi:hypothetical protein